MPRRPDRHHETSSYFAQTENMPAPLNEAEYEKTLTTYFSAFGDRAHEGVTDVFGSFAWQCSPLQRIVPDTTDHVRVHDKSLIGHAFSIREYEDHDRKGRSSDRQFRPTMGGKDGGGRIPVHRMAKRLPAASSTIGGSGTERSTNTMPGCHATTGWKSGKRKPSTFISRIGWKDIDV